MHEQETNIKIFIDTIEPRFEEFWNILALMKSLKSNEALLNGMVSFQFDLALCLSDINIEYLKISKQLKELRLKHKSFSKTDFSSQKNNLIRCLDALKQLIYLGKGMGDAFAWFFYQKERKMLHKHLERQEVFLLPTGPLGKIGELEFIRNFKILGNGNIVIYHGITNMLRLRDISLIEIRSMKLTGIGELKTNKGIGDEISITLHTIGQKQKINEFTKEINEDIKSPEKKNPNEKRQENDSRKDRLEKQIIDLISAFKIYSDESNKGKELVQANSYFKELENVVNENTVIGSSSYRKAGDGMLFIAVRPEGKKLSEKLFEESKREWTNSNELIESFLSIIDNNSQENGKVFGSIHYNNEGKINFLQGSKPLFWLPVSIDVIKQIYFKDVQIITIYNPLYLKRKIENLGFKLEYVEFLKRYCFVKKDISPNMTLDHWKYFLSLIGNHLIDEEAVVNSIELFLKRIINGKMQGKTKINLEIYQM